MHTVSWLHTASMTKAHYFVWLQPLGGIKYPMSFNRFIYVSRDLEAARPPPLSLERHYSTRCEHLMLAQLKFLLETWSKWLKTPPQESQLINMSPCYFLWAMSRGWLSLCASSPMLPSAWQSPAAYKCWYRGSLDLSHPLIVYLENMGNKKRRKKPTSHNKQAFVNHAFLSTNHTSDLYEHCK